MWQRPARQWDLPSREMDRFHRFFGERTVPLTEMPLWDSLTTARDDLPDSAERQELTSALSSLGDLAADRPQLAGAWHGDWTPWNMGRRHHRLQLWDWERFETGVPAGLDVCHYGVNAVCRRDGVSLESVRRGLMLAGCDPDDGPASRLTAATYLATITTRYLLGAESELGEAIRDRSRIMLHALTSCLDGVPR